MSQLNVKQALSSALKNRLYSSSFDSITVSSLCIECKINRKTFYNHFDDKYKLAIYLFESEFINQNNQNDYTIFQILNQLCCYLSENRIIYKKLFSYSEKDFITAFKNYLTSLLQTVEYKKSDVNSNFLANALTINFYEWLINGEEVTPCQFFGELKTFLENFF